MSQLLLLLTVLGLLTCSSYGIEIKRVIISTNDNPLYIEFWPVVARVWQSMGIRPTLALIADEECAVDTSLGDVIRFSPIPGISTALQAQVYRLFLPVLFPEEGCLISDIDIIPISRTYFVEGASPCPDQGFLVYRDNAFGPRTNQYPMCYVAALGSVFASVFQVYDKSQFADRIRQWTKISNCWETDQWMLYRLVNAWERKGGLVVRLGHDVGPRIDRSDWQTGLNPDEILRYIDCHCPRPYSAYKASIDRIVYAVVLGL